MQNFNRVYKYVYVKQGEAISAMLSQELYSPTFTWMHSTYMNIMMFPFLIYVFDDGENEMKCAITMIRKLISKYFHETYM